MEINAEMQVPTFTQFAFAGSKGAQRLLGNLNYNTVDGSFVWFLV